MLLTGRLEQIFFWNPFAQALLPNAQMDHNYNVCIAGQSDSGKSVFMNELLTTTLGIGETVVVLNFGRSFKEIYCLGLRIHGVIGRLKLDLLSRLFYFTNLEEYGLYQFPDLINLIRELVLFRDKAGI